MLSNANGARQASLGRSPRNRQFRSRAESPCHFSSRRLLWDGPSALIVSARLPGAAPQAGLARAFGALEKRRRASQILLNLVPFRSDPYFRHFCSSPCPVIPSEAKQSDLRHPWIVACDVPVKLVTLRQMKARRQNLWRWALALLSVICIAGLGCRRASADAGPVAGTYKGHYEGCTEVIMLKSDGTFSQTIKFKDRIYKNKGKWKYEIRPSGLSWQNKVSFFPFLVAVDTDKQTAFDPPVKYLLYDGDWVQEDNRIEFRAEFQYWVQKSD